MPSHELEELPEQLLEKNPVTTVIAFDEFLQVIVTGLLSAHSQLLGAAAVIKSRFAPPNPPPRSAYISEHVLTTSSTAPYEGEFERPEHTVEP